MAQGPITAATALSGSKQVLNNQSALGNLKSTAVISDSLKQVPAISAASILKAGAGIVASANNTAVLTTTAVAALTTSSIGLLYDAAVTGLSLTTTQVGQLASSNVAPLTTTQVATLTTTQIVGLIPQAQLGTLAVIPKVGLDTPTNSSIVVVPGVGQILTVVFE